MIYCPYADANIPEEQARPEHIIPLSLGGVNGFQIPVDATLNSTLGSELDGALGKEFLFSLRRTKFDARGHSGKRPIATIKNATYGEGDRPAQVHFDSRGGLRVWDSRDREVKERVPSFTISTSLNIDLPVRFTAKVALSAGYFAYGDLFRDYVDHRSLRYLMNTDPARLDSDNGFLDQDLGHIDFRADTYLHEVTEQSNFGLYFLRACCSKVEGSSVVLIPGHECFTVAVAIFGQYVGTVSVPANTETFPTHDDYSSGHVLIVDGKTLERRSLDDWFLEQLLVLGLSSDEIERALSIPDDSS